MLTITSRRRFLLGAGALIAAPSIVRAQSLMPVSVVEVPAPRPETNRERWERIFAEVNARSDVFIDYVGAAIVTDLTVPTGVFCPRARQWFTLP